MTDSDNTSPGTASPGNAGLRTRESSSGAGPEPPVPSSASPEPRVPKGAGPEPPVPSIASPEPRVPRGASTEPRGWHSRGYLPHFDSSNLTQHVTFHLADSLPKAALDRLALELDDLDPLRREVEKRRRLEALIDAGHGACWLRRPDCAHIVQDSLLHFDGDRYRLMAWAVMPNHVHALFQTMDGWSMDSVVGSWKTFTANAIGRLIITPGAPVPRVWHPEFWDRYIRDHCHFMNAVAYIQNNPVKAGLAQQLEEWPWSSAFAGNATSGDSAPGNAGLRTRESSSSANTSPAFPEKADGVLRESPNSASTEPRVPRES